MDVRPPMQAQQHVSGSWNPALRPNVLDLDNNAGAKGPGTVEDETLDLANGVAPSPYQSLTQPESVSQDLLEPAKAATQEAEWHPLIQDTAISSGAEPEGRSSTTGIEQDHELHESADLFVGKEALDAAPKQGIIAANSLRTEESRVYTTDEADIARRQSDDGHRMTSTESGQSDESLGEQSDMSRAWELEAEKSQVNDAAELSRTNSFPEVPPLQQSQPPPMHPLPHSQAEDIVDEETAQASIKAFSLHADSPTTNIQDVLISERGSVTVQSKRQSTGVITEPAIADAQSRYEEGIPLMQSSSQNDLQDFFQSQDSGAITGGMSQTDGEDDFFAQDSPQRVADGNPTKPHALDRKSTTQVLDAMKYPSHDTTHRQFETQEDNPPSSTFHEESVAPSNDFVEPLVNGGHNSDTSEPKKGDEDLAALWKAALGDDDDDLLDEDESSLDPSAFFHNDGDGEGFGALLSQPTNSSETEKALHGHGIMAGPMDSSYPKPMASQNRYSPANSFDSTPYPGPLQFRTSYMGNAAPAPPYASQSLPRPQMPASTQSFADKSKGGYTSPYDIPMDVTRPKKRTTFQQTRLSTQSQPPADRPPPPRSSSMFAGAPPSLTAQPPVPSLTRTRMSTPADSGVSAAPRNPPNTGSFFEELPSSISRPTSSIGRSVHPINQHNLSPQIAPPREPTRLSSLPQQAASNGAVSSQEYQLLPPERMGLYSNADQEEIANRAVPATISKYSPAPSQPSTIPPPRNRYAPSPSAGARLPPSQPLPFQPRTSSPLAQNHIPPQQQQQQQVPSTDPSFRRPQSKSSEGPGASSLAITSPSYPFPPQQHQSTGGHEPNYMIAAASNSWRQSPPPVGITQHPPLNSFATHPTNIVPSPESSSQSLIDLPRIPDKVDVAPYVPQNVNIRPPKRSQTQSPGAGKYTPEAEVTITPYQRPASVNHHISRPGVQSNLPIASHGMLQGNHHELSPNYIKPSDGREMDPLERWRGCPIISSGFGGIFVTNFPTQVPRFAAGQSTPLMKRSPGEVKLQVGKVITLDEGIATFPGPLKSKSKKKEILDWMNRRISKLENNLEFPSDKTTHTNVYKRCEEKVFLWKIVRLLVEYDGAVDGAVESAARFILSPGLAQVDAAAAPSESVGSNDPGISPHAASPRTAAAGKPGAVEELRKILLQGDREKAVWHAVDEQLWAHAMLLASTLDKNIWKQVSQEFVRQEVKTCGENTEALASLYQIFAGNWEESADELVPPSARAGLQMVSKSASAAPTTNALDGLDRWRETLTLILSNRSPEDGKALVSLGQLLAGYGRTEAAHICYIFAKSATLFGGPDDPQVAIALLGTDHHQQPFDYGRDLDSILLTETYDFARTVLTSASAATVSPHLQSLKLYHAMVLAEHGLKSEAQQYCEHITSTLNSTTKRSPFYHSLLLGALDNLIERLRQAPRDTSASWISKPSIDKVSGSIWAKFNQYVAGDESDAASTGSGKAPDGPFAAVTGESPAISRTPSTNELYGAYNPSITQGAPVISSSPSKVRYAPPGVYTPRPSLEHQGRSLQDQSRITQSDLLRPSLSQPQYQSRPSSSAGSYSDPYEPTVASFVHPARSTSNLPTPPSQPEYMPDVPPEAISTSLYGHENNSTDPSIKPQPSQYSGLSQSSIHPPAEDFPPSFKYEPASPVPPEPIFLNGYEPDVPSAYNPPSYEPVSSEAQQSPIESKPKKKSFMDDDDDDDFEARAAALRKEEKLRKDREADEAFKRAAEADGKASPTPMSL